MKADQVVSLLHALHDRGLRAWVAGGWAVDAVAGRQSRPHRDLDLAIDAGQLSLARAVLADLGFALTVDWLPVRAELTAADGRKVDIHPVNFAADGSGTQAGLDGMTFFYAADGFDEGRIAGERVPCLSVTQQLRFRQGYELRDTDHHDLALLRQHDR
ncbi:amino acid transporter [Planosporangium thailandense]|uniref:Amino acid transporter n=1 Tax=Planosporangium thailandense TaxID=765197 RepID=A0ABX0XV63_9ACTN|nr:amino acid transporter [Planosporangium thailandense]NJC69094.1 amino acid transporter [Planosporangium thailandense]